MLESYAILSSMEETLISIKNDLVARVLAADTEDELNRIKLEVIGRSGTLTAALKDLPKVPVEKRPEIGRLANEIKKTIETVIEERLKDLKKSSFSTVAKGFDVTLPGRKPLLGHLHPVTQAIEEITAIFSKIGFYRVRYPEVEWDYYAFEALNFPDNHPARDDWETFFIDLPADKKFGPIVLTPHTSSGQVREMQGKSQKSKVRNQNEESITIKMLNIAKCYRRQSDISHTEMFHQFEGLVVGKDIAITHLKGVLEYFVKSYFGEQRKSRIRPYHFQFTEPSFEVDINCGICLGSGIRTDNHEPCKLCKSGWLELGGAGMVHPVVLRNGGIDPDVYSGFAFGWGIERTYMMRSGTQLDDIRLLYGNDLRFLQQF